MVKRSQRPGTPRPVRKPDPKPLWGNDGHSGEGSASALEMLQKLEKRRLPRHPEEPAADEERPLDR